MRKLGMFFILGVLAGSFAEGKKGGNPFFPSQGEFSAAMSRFESEPLPKALRDKDHRIFYAPVGSLFWSQPSYAFLKVRENIQEAETDYEVKFKDGEYEFDHDDGQSIYPDHRSIKVIRYGHYLYIVDGHHKHAASVFFGARTVPVEVVADWNNLDLSERKFRQKMVNEGLAYPYEQDGRPSERFWLPSEVINDDLLYLARLIEHKIKLEIRFGELRVLSHSGAPKPLVLKLNEDVPFLEYYIAKELADAGIVYDPAWGSDLPAHVLDRIRSVLLRAWQRKDSKLRLALIVKADLDLRRMDESSEVRDQVVELILKHFRSRIQCGRLLTSEVRK